MKGNGIKSILLISSIFFIANSLRVAAEVLPSDVQTFFQQGKYYVVKTYLIPEEEDPAQVIGKSFEQNGVIYNQSDIEITPITEEEKKDIKQTESVSVSSQSVNQALSKLSAQKDYTDEEGFTGVLYPDANNIAFSVNSYTTKTYTASDSKYYYNLPSRDTSNIAKSITSQGIAMSVTNIEWIDSNNSDSGDTAVGGNFTAKADYSGTYTKKIPNGYTAVVPYKGEATRQVTHQKECKVTYIGEKINLPLSENPETNPRTKVFAKGMIVSGAVFGISLGFIVAYCLIKKWKSKKEEE